jgi:hypothetical protein
MTPRHLQYIMAAVFFVLGGWCIIAPDNVIDLGIRPDYQPDDTVAPLFMACFGAQACIAGLFCTFSTFTRTTFLAYGIGVLPFFWFDYYFYVVDPIFTEFILLDAVGNVIFVVMCVWGYRMLTPSPRPVS